MTEIIWLVMCQPPGGPALQVMAFYDEAEAIKCKADQEKRTPTYQYWYTSLTLRKQFKEPPTDG